MKIIKEKIIKAGFILKDFEQNNYDSIWVFTDNTDIEIRIFKNDIIVIFNKETKQELLRTTKLVFECIFTTLDLKFFVGESIR